LPKPNVHARIQRIAELKQASPRLAMEIPAVSVDDAQTIEFAAPSTKV
jgi:hypothetical protein